MAGPAAGRGQGAAALGGPQKASEGLRAAARAAGRGMAPGRAPGGLRAARGRPEGPQQGGRA